MSRRDKPFVVLHSDTGVDVVALEGDIDHHEGAPRLEKTLSKLASRGAAKVLLDFREVTYCCSGAIALILDAADALSRAGGGLVCAVVTGAAREPMDLLSIPDVVRFYDTVAEALDALEALGKGDAAGGD
jgi:anti-anti-sigma factor